ncbi:MAG: hypothetical protein ABI165_05930, partial [Bryobacteraceae bacterium]
MFEQSLVLETGQSRTGWTFAASCIGETIVIGGLALAPLLYTQALPMVEAVAWRLPAPSPPPAPVTQTTAELRRETRARVFHGMEAPLRIPDKVAPLIEQPAMNVAGAAGDASGPGVPGGMGNALLGVPVISMAPPPQPAAPQPQHA